MAIFRLLHAITFQILLCHGRYPGQEPLADYDRLPLRGSIRSEPSALTYLMVAPPTGFPRQAKLDSGPFDFYQLVGSTEAEARYARSHDRATLVDMLQAQDAFPVTNSDPQSVVEVS